MSAKYDNTDGRLRGRKAQQRRLRIWSKDPQCGMCRVLTSYPSGFEIDHRTPRHFGGSEEDENLWCLCIRCHRVKTAGESSATKTVAYFPEWLPPPIGPLTIVFGPPGSGKSTYVSEHRRSTDAVIDLDEIASLMSGLPIYKADETWLGRAVYERNEQIAALSRVPQSAWLITTGKGKRTREWWEQKLKPSQCITIATDAATCIARINADERRPKAVKTRHIAEVRSWWAAETSLFDVQITRERVSIGADGWPSLSGG